MTTVLDTTPSSRPCVLLTHKFCSSLYRQSLPSVCVVTPLLNASPACFRTTPLRWEEAVRDYRAVLEVAPEDPAAWNNLGNATAGQCVAGAG